MMAYKDFYNASELSHSLNLKCQNGTHHGPCPSCGYKSGFTLDEKNGKLLFYCHAGGCSFEEIITAIKYHSPAAISAIPAIVNYREYFKNLSIATGCDSKAQFIKKLWSESEPVEDTIVEAYLKNRGITGNIPKTLRYLKSCFHSPSQANYPAMVAKVTDVNGQLMAVHRTYLKPDGSGKAVIEPNKMILGLVKGCGVYLSGIANTIAVTEGIENALVIQQTTGISTIAALSAVGITNLILPAQVQFIIICADYDKVGLQAAYNAAKKWNTQGKTVKVVTPPKIGMDFNDWLLGREIA